MCKSFLSYSKNHMWKLEVFISIIKWNRICCDTTLESIVVKCELERLIFGPCFWTIRISVLVSHPAYGGTWLLIPNHSSLASYIRTNHPRTNFCNDTNSLTCLTPSQYKTYYCRKCSNPRLSSCTPASAGRSWSCPSCTRPSLEDTSLLLVH